MRTVYLPCPMGQGEKIKALVKSFSLGSIWKFWVQSQAPGSMERKTLGQNNKGKLTDTRHPEVWLAEWE